MTPRGSDTPEMATAVRNVQRSNEAAIGQQEANQKLLTARAGWWHVLTGILSLIGVVLIVCAPALVVAIYRWAFA